MNSVVHERYLRFPEEELEAHFSPGGTQSNRQKWVQHYLKSAASYRAFEVRHSSPAGIPVSKSRSACQVEKDERFWTADTLMTFFHHEDCRPRLADLLTKAYGPTPPIAGSSTWPELLSGELDLYFEVDMPSPDSYKQWLRENLSGRQFIPHIRHAAYTKKRKTHLRSTLEGPTQLDALVLNKTNGFAIAFEAKVLSDVSSQVTFDVARNQIARMIDVLLEDHTKRKSPLSRRRPESTLYMLLTPRMFQELRSSRLYGWLYDDYRTHPDSLGRDLPHRSLDWSQVSGRLGWVTWEDCAEILPGACPWTLDDTAK